MQKPSISPHASDQLPAALEACCGSLRALEAVSASTAPEDEDRHPSIARAIELLREAISELRALQSEDSHCLAGGFVLPAPSGHRRRG